MYRKPVFFILVVSCLVILSACTCEHNWQEANCVSPQTCVSCGEISGEPIGHVYQAATCTDAMICSVCGVVQGEPLGHTWAEATCTTPKTCTVCSETEGANADHIWLEATCTSPKECSECHVTEGVKLAHQVNEWETITDATCVSDGTKVGTCVLCNAVTNVSIPSNGHEWIDATTAAPKTCSVCGETEGKPLIVYKNMPEGLSVDETEWENWKSQNTCMLYPFMSANKKLNFTYTIPSNSDKNHKVSEFVFTDNGKTKTLKNTDFYYGLDGQDIVYLGLSTSNKSIYASSDFEDACIRILLSYNIHFDSDSGDAVLHLSRSRAKEIVEFCFENEIEHCVVDDMRIRLIRDDDYYSFHIEY